MEHPVIQHHKRRHLNPKIKRFLYMTGDFIGTCLVGAYRACHCCCHDWGMKGGGILCEAKSNSS